MCCWFCWSGWCAGGGGTTGVFAGGKFDAVGLELFSGPGQVVRSGFKGAKGGTFCGCWSVGLKLLSEERDQWGVKGAGLGCFVGDCGALGCVDGFRNSIQVEALVPNFL